MRQRKIKNLEEKMQELQRYIIEDGTEHKGNWQSFFGNKSDIFLEIGAGKGQFLIRQAQNHPDRNYIGIEGQTSVVFRALQKLAEQDEVASQSGQESAGNIMFIRKFVNSLCEIFEDEEVAGIYLNFSDPWPKKGHAHRRLTYRNRLSEYHKILKEGGTIEFKTDNDDLFDFTEEEVSEVKRLFKIDEVTRDLHASDFVAKNIETEYEEKFKSLGKNINYMRLVKL